jgi:hypothetical protein
VKRLLLLCLLSLLAACGPKYAKPDAMTEEQANRADYECERDARLVGGGLMFYHRCLESMGFRKRY